MTAAHLNLSHTTRLKVLICLALGFGSLALFSPVRRYEFLNYDDGHYVTENPHVTSGFSYQNMLWAFTNSHSTNWHPLTWLSHMLDINLWGLNAGAHHLTNVGFHIANTILLFLVFTSMTGAVWRSAFVAALFAWHPLHVESVAWISERKDVLSTFFWLTTMAAYLRYVKKPQAVSYLLVIVLFACGLMSKPMVVTLPFVLLLLDYWPLQRVRLCPTDSRGWRRLLVEKVPLLAMAVISCVVTFVVQERAGAVVPLDAFSLQMRLSNALIRYVTYLSKSFWPIDLAVFYPMRNEIPLWQITGAALLLLAGTALVLIAAKKKPYLPVGWFWYLGTLVPVIGVVQVGNQAMADRYMYLPMIGLSVATVWGTPELFAKVFNRPNQTRLALSVVAIFVLLVYSAVTAKQLTYWRNSVTIFTHALSVTSNNWLAHSNLGKALADEGKIDEAAHHFQAAVQIRPNDARALSDLAVARTLNGDPKAGVEYGRQAVQLKPDDPVVQNNLGFVLLRVGDVEKAIDHCTEALRLKPDWGEANGNLGSALLAQGKSAEALVHFRNAVQLEPDSVNALNNLAWFLAANFEQGYRNGAQAVILARRAAVLSQYQNPNVLDTLAAALAENKQFDDAAKIAEQARTLALSRGDAKLATGLLKRRELYKRGLTYRK